MGVRNRFEKCCVQSFVNEKQEKVVKNQKCLSFLNCFFGDPDTIDDEVKEFKFNKNVIDLNRALGDKRLILIYSINFIVYYALVAFVPAYFRGVDTVKWQSHYIYAGYAFLVFLFEAYLTYFIISKVNFGRGNKILKDFSLANYLLPLILSQIKKYDFYTDIVFIIANLNEDRTHIAIISSCFLAITTFANLIMILTLFKALWNIKFTKLFCFLCIRQQEKVIHPSNRKSLQKALSLGAEKNTTFLSIQKIDTDASNKNINLFCKVSSLLELECIGNCLDKFSTKNAWFFPYFGGYYIPQQIISATLKFLFEDLPSFTIQVFVLSYYEGGKSYLTITPIIVTTVISLVASVITVLTAKASILKKEELKKIEKDKIEIEDETTKREKEKKTIIETEKMGDSIIKEDGEEKKVLIQD